jgi:hypothetical protein
MPLLRYFFYVGGALLGLILISNFVLPQAPLPSTLTSATDLPPVRIHSDRKLPERVVLDTSSTVSTKPVPMLAPVTVTQATAPAPASAEVAEIPPKARVREAFAQLPDEQASKSKAAPVTAAETKAAPVTAAEPKAVSKPAPKRKVAKPRPGPVMVAQQPFFGRFWVW